MVAAIGKIVKSTSHVDYVCQVFGRGEQSETPALSDHAFAQFVRIQIEDPGAPDLVGVIYNTILMNPEFGSLGPRLSPRSDLEVFSPDYLNEQVTLVGILVAGSLPKDASAPAFQGIPALAARVDAQVCALDDDDFRRFHGGNVVPQLAYIPHLLSQGSPLMLHLLLQVLDHVGRRFPHGDAELAVLRDNLAWRLQVEQAR